MCSHTLYMSMLLCGTKMCVHTEVTQWLQRRRQKNIMCAVVHCICLRFFCGTKMCVHTEVTQWLQMRRQKNIMCAVVHCICLRFFCGTKTCMHGTLYTTHQSRFTQHINHALHNTSITLYTTHQSRFTQHINHKLDQSNHTDLCEPPPSRRSCYSNNLYSYSYVSSLKLSTAVIQ